MSKEKILKKIRKALLDKTDMPYPDVPMDAPLFHESDEPLEVQFAEELNKVNGEFIYCEYLAEFVENLEALIKKYKWSNIHCWDPLLEDVFRSANFSAYSDNKDLSQAEVGITRCEALIARTGSALISSMQSSGRKLSIWPPVHIIVATPNQVLADVSDGMKLMKEKYGEDLPSMISLTTGPSRTADIGAELVIGAQGPKKLFVFLVEM